VTNALRYVNVSVDGTQAYQTIDGFGVNINSKYWGAPAFDTALELLVNGIDVQVPAWSIFTLSNGS